MAYQIRMCYALPERLRTQRDEEGNPVLGADGRVKKEREPGSPTRPAGVRDVNCWWERLDRPLGYAGTELAFAMHVQNAGGIIREVEDGA